MAPRLRRPIGVDAHRGLAASAATGA